MGVVTARARVLASSSLEAVGLFKLAEAVLKPVMVPVARKNLRRFYGRLVRPGDLVFDIGANVGEHARVLLKLGADVVCVEPQSDCVAVLQNRFGDRAAIVHAAVSDTIGEAELMLNTVSNERATLSEDHVHTGRFSRGWDGSERVATTTLDALVAEYGPPAVCKIDVEGLEAQVLSGLSQPIPTVVFEFHEGLPGTRAALQELERLGKYSFSYRVGRSPKLLGSWDAETVYAELPRVAYGDVVATLADR